MQEKPILLIFDIDGTLTDSAGLTRVAYEKAFIDIYSIANSTKNINPYGLTDPLIFREMLKNCHLTEDGFNEQFNRFSKLTSFHLKRELDLSDKPRLHNGIADLLFKLEQNDQIYLALGTGNVERNARLKIEIHGINRFFPVGGFGSDAENRTEIIKTAYKRACDYYKTDFSKQHTWVIGDTDHDINCGKAIGANTIAVATGVYNNEVLTDYNPTAVFTDFTDYERFINIINNNEIPHTL